MKTTIKILLTLAAVLMLAGIGLFCWTMAGNGWDLSSLGSVSTKTTDVEEAFRSIQIDADTEDVVFLPSSDGRCHVEFRERKKETHTASVQNGTLLIESRNERKWYDSFSLFRFEASRITVFLPQAEYASLSVRLSTGDISIPADLAFGEIQLSLRTGDATCRASASGLIRIDTSTGGVRLEDISVGEIQITASTGHVELRSVRCSGDMSLKLSTGKTTLTDLSCRQLICSGSTGDIKLKNVLASDLISLTRSTGDVEFDGCDAGELIVKTDTGSVTGSLRSEKIFFAQSGTGRVQVPETTVGGTCRITTGTGSIRITLAPEADAQGR